MDKLESVLMDVFGTTDIQFGGDWDSLSHMELIAALEKEFEIEFTLDQIVEMQSAEKIRETLDELTG